MEAPKPVAPAEARQRWRLVYARSATAPHLAPRDQQAAWEGGLQATGLPIIGLELAPPRPRIAFAAPLTVGLPADRELADLFLAARRPVADVRAALAAHLPDGHRLVELHDVWLGEAALAGQVAAADYRASVRVAGGAIGPASVVLADAATRLLDSATLPRTRDKGGRDVAYDLRPLLGDISILGTVAHLAGDATGPDGPTEASEPLIGLRIRVRYDPERGVGRPDEVLAALASASGLELAFEALVRERLILAGDH